MSCLTVRCYFCKISDSSLEEWHFFNCKLNICIGVIAWSEFLIASVSIDIEYLYEKLIPHKIRRREGRWFAFGI